MGSGRGKTRRTQGLLSRRQQPERVTAEEAARRYGAGEISLLESFNLVEGRLPGDQGAEIGKLRKTERISWVSKEQHKATKRADVVIVLESDDGEHEEYTIKQNVRTLWGGEIWRNYGIGRHEGGWWKPQVAVANAFNQDQSPGEREGDKALWEAWQRPYDVRLVTADGLLYYSAREVGELKGLKDSASEAPPADVNIYTGQGVAPLGGDVEPLNRLAARTDAERAEYFPFTAEDRELLNQVLSDESS